MSASCSPVRIFSHENDLHQELNHKVGIRGEFQDPNVKLPSSSSINEGSTNRKEEDHVLESAKAEMGEVREENERLKKMLQQVETDYHSLKLRFFGILQQESSNNDSADPSYEDTEESELVSLSLGRTTPETNNKKDGKAGSSKQDGEFKDSLTLGLDSKFENSTNPSPTNSSEQQVLVKEDEGGETRGPPSKIQKINSVEDEVARVQNNVKRARVCVRARCDTPTMNDGCHWRKYGQKISKGNPCPRAYYRCTVAPACPVRKQVQRCSDDMSILITTYEGTHNHQLPVSATSMASTTAAAASMLLSGSSTSQPLLNSGHTTTAGINFNLYNNSISNQIYLPNPSSPLYPTITLDLTSPPLNRLSRFNTTIPSSTLSFSSTDNQSKILPSIWGSGYQFNNSYNLYNQQKNNQVEVQPQQALTETLTKAITCDPSLRTVIAAALSSMMGTGSSSSQILGAESSGCGSSYFSGLSTVNSQMGSSGILQSGSTSPFCIFNSASAPTLDKDHKS